MKGQKDQNAVLVLLGKDETALKGHPVLGDLLAPNRTSDDNGLVPGRLLLVDEDSLQRRLASSQLQSIGCRFHSAESYDRAFQILKADPEVSVVLLDYGQGESQIDDVVRKVKTTRPDALIVGTSTAFRKREFEQVGVDRFLLKPVVGSALVRLLQE